MRNLLTYLFFILLFNTSFGQITEVRRIAKTLCSPEFQGRGYVNGGDSIAAQFIAEEFKKIGVRSLKRSYFQHFSFGVNTFPRKMEMKLDEKELIPGTHFLVDPSSKSCESILKPKLISAKIALDQERLIAEIKEIINKTSSYNSVVFNFGNLSVDTLKLLASIKYEVAEFVPVIEVVNKKFMWSVGRDQLKNPIIQVQDSIFKDNKEWKAMFGILDKLSILLVIGAGLLVFVAYQKSSGQKAVLDDDKLAWAKMIVIGLGLMIFSRYCFGISKTTEDSAGLGAWISLLAVIFLALETRIMKLMGK